MSLLVTKTGFRAITHEIIFQLETMNKGKKLVLAGHVLEVEDIRQGDMTRIIKARVVRQTSVTATAYKTTLFLNTAKKHKCEPFQFNVSDLKEDCALKCVLEADANSNAEDIESSVSKVVQSLVEQTDNNLQREDCVICLENFNVFRQEFPVYKSSALYIEPTLYNFYLVHLVMEDTEISKLCCDTIQQSMCEAWHSARRLRISSSTNVHNIKVRKTKTVESLAQQILFPKPVECAATRYGTNNEKYALEEYQILKNCRVFRLGVIVSKEQPWLCASVDGVVVQDECVKMLVEVKCPISCKNQPIVDFDKKKSNVQYLELVNDDKPQWFKWWSRILNSVCNKIPVNK